jgi:hypothetical protein
MKREKERERETLTSRYGLYALGSLPKAVSSLTHAEANI